MIAAYNEKGVIAQTLQTVGALDYPKGDLQVIVADDSTDQTRDLIDEGKRRLEVLGTSVVVSRRENREGYKAEALNIASRYIDGDYVMLLDSDSRPSSDCLKLGLVALRNRADLSFVAFRVGHYNRGETVVTRSFALFQDTVDTIQKMGSLPLDAPFSLQGGFALLKTAALKKAGFWTNGALADDADLSCKLYSAGEKGAYLSDVKVMSEDPGSLLVWKRQFARVSWGWAQCLRSQFGRISSSAQLPAWKKLALILNLSSPLASLDWIVVSIATALALISGAISPSGSVFSNPAYVGLISLPAVAFVVTGLRALRIQGMLSAGNILLIPELSYIVSGMFVVSSIAFLSGLSGSKGTFYRTPKRGEGKATPEPTGRIGRSGWVELALSSVAILLSVGVLLKAQWFLGLSLLGLGTITLKSMNLTWRWKGGLE